METQSTIIDRLYRENEDLLNYLRDKGEISFLSDVEDTFRKTLLLAVASYFESELVNGLLSFFIQHTKHADLILHFIQNKAVKRQYHTYFDWDGKNANSFFGLFGDGFKNYLKAEIENDLDLDKGIRAFLELGRERNALIHQNFASYEFQKTAKEIYELYQIGLHFVMGFPKKLQDYIVDPANTQSSAQNTTSQRLDIKPSEEEI